MKALLICLSAGLVVCNALSSSVHYKRIQLSGSVWPKLIHTTVAPKVNSLAECGAFCQSMGPNGCHLFARDKVTKECHLGTVTTDANVKATYTGTDPVYFSIGDGN